MAVGYKHFTFLQLLLMFVLLVDITELVGAAKGHFHRRYFADYSRSRNHREINVKKNRTNNTITSIKKLPVSTVNKMNNAKPVQAQTGSTAILHCDTTKIGDVGKPNITVIWIKMYDNNFEILTDGDKVLTRDKRIYASNEIDDKDWSLYIRFAKSTDEGLYQCQLCSKDQSIRFKSSIFVKLVLKEAEAVIIGAPEKEVEKAGSPLRLSCMLIHSIEPPKYIFWYHEDRMINYDLNDGATVRHGRQGSELIFPRAQKKHAGNYSCVPSNARQASVKVIIMGSETSSMTENEKGSGKKSYPQDHILNMLVLISTFHLYR